MIESWTIVHVAVDQRTAQVLFKTVQNADSMLHLVVT